MIKDLVNAVKRVLFVDECVEEDPKRPHILFLATIGFALQDLGSGIICYWVALAC